jgi:hypothetical protein
MVGSHYLKHLYQLSDEDVEAQCVENRYWQHLCDSQYFEHELPIRPTSMTKWRANIAAADAGRLLAETIAAGLQLKIVKPQSLQRMVVDTTVQPKGGGLSHRREVVRRHAAAAGADGAARRTSSVAKLCVLRQTDAGGGGLSARAGGTRQGFAHILRS